MSSWWKWSWDSLESAHFVSFTSSTVLQVYENESALDATSTLQHGNGPNVFNQAYQAYIFTIFRSIQGHRNHFSAQQMRVDTHAVLRRQRCVIRVTRVLRGDPISTIESGEWPEGAYIDDFQPFAFIFRSRKTRCATLNGCRHCTSRHTSQNSEQRYVFIVKKKTKKHNGKLLFPPTPYRAIFIHLNPALTDLRGPAN